MDWLLAQKYRAESAASVELISRLHVSFGATESKIAVEILLYLPQCLDSLSKPKIQMLLLASCDTSIHEQVLLWGHNPSLLSGLFL